MGWGGASRDLRGWGWGKKIFHVIQGGTSMGQDKTKWGKGEGSHPLATSHPIAIPKPHSSIFP